METTREKIIAGLVKYFYATDLALDESDLDAFHDKSIATKKAEIYADAFITTIREDFKDEVLKALPDKWPHDGRVIKPYERGMEDGHNNCRLDVIEAITNLT